MEIAIIVLAVIIIAAASYLRTPSGKGRLGEARVRWIIGKTKQGTRYVINDYMFICDGKSVQIDHIVINKNGVYIIETKNYSGRVYGSDEQRHWLQVLAFGKVKNKLYSPVKQNAAHIYKLGKVLPLDVYLTSIVVFVQNNTQYIRSDTAVPISVLKKRLALPSKLKPYTVDEMEKIYRALEEVRGADITAREHINRINEARELVKHNLCPICRMPLVTRNGRYGEYLGCSGYPECTYTKKG